MWSTKTIRTMKTKSIFSITALLVLFAAILALPSCTKEQQEDLALEAELLLEYGAIEFTVDSGIPQGAFELALSFDGEALGRIMADNGYSMDQLKEFRFNKADLRILSPDGQTYDPVQSVLFELSLVDHAPVTIANMDPVPDGATTVSLNVGDVNVAEIARSSSAQLKVKAFLEGPVEVTTLNKLELGGKVVVRL